MGYTWKFRAYVEEMYRRHFCCHDDRLSVAFFLVSVCVEPIGLETRLKVEVQKFVSLRRNRSSWEVSECGPCEP